MIPLGIADAWSTGSGGHGPGDAPWSLPTARRRVGVALLVLAVAMNVPFTLLAATFDYPDVLRRGADEVLPRVHAGGARLLGLWYAYALVAAAFVPVSLGVRRILATPFATLPGAALAGVLAGVFQAMGLLRWVFVVPGLAAVHAEAAAGDPARTAASVAFTAIHQLFGVAIGEHLGQVCTAVWTLAVARALVPTPWCPRWLPWLGRVAAALLLLGQAEAFATVVSFPLGPLALAVPVGFLLWSLWLAALGVVLLRAGSTPANAVARRS